MTTVSLGSTAAMTQERHLPAFAQAYGSASPQPTGRRVINRRKEPGVKTQARMLRLVTENIGTAHGRQSS
jgi:hypothetical protein